MWSEITRGKLREAKSQQECSENRNCIHEKIKNYRTVVCYRPLI